MAHQLPSHEQIVGLLVRHQDQLYRYVFAIVPHASDAWDILQEATMAMYRKAGDYDPERPFLPWAFKFAALTALDWRKRAGRRPALLSNEILEQIAEEREEQQSELDQRLISLEECLEKLPLKERDLVRLRYESPESLEQIAELKDLSLRTLHRRLDLIRQKLRDCINNSMIEQTG